MIKKWMFYALMSLLASSIAIILSKEQYQVWDINFISTLNAIVVFIIAFVVYIFYNRRFPPFYLQPVLIGIIYAVNVLFVGKANDYVDNPAIKSAALKISPITVAILSYLWLKIPFSFKKIPSYISLIVGVILVIYGASLTHSVKKVESESESKSKSKSEEVKGKKGFNVMMFSVYILIAVLFSTVGTVWTKKVISNLNVNDFMFWLYIGYIILPYILSSIKHRSGNIWKFDLQRDKEMETKSGQPRFMEYLYIPIMGASIYLLEYFRNSAVKIAPNPSYVGVVTSLNIVISALLSSFIFKTSMLNMIEWFGFGFILFSGVLMLIL